MGSTTSKIAIIAALATLWPAIASSQQGGAGTSGGTQIDLGVSTTLQGDSNFSMAPGSSPGTSYINDTQLTFGLNTATSAYSFDLTASTVLRFADLPNRSVAGLEDPSVQMRFVANSLNSRLTIDGNYKLADREFLDPFQVDQESRQFGTLVGNGGTLRQTGLGLTYELGLNAPIGFVLDLRHDKKDYENVLNTTIFDSETNSAGVTLSYRLSAVATARTSFGLTKFTAADAPAFTDRTTTDYAVGIAYDIDPTLTLDAQIGHTEIETIRATTGTTNDSGLTGAITLTKAMPNGSVFGTLNSTTNQNGERVTLSFGRDLQLPTGNLRAVLGATRGQNGETSWIASVAYDKQLLNDTLTLTFDRSAATNTLDQEILDTRFGIAYSHPVNSNSRLNVDLNFAQSEDVTGGGAVAAAPTIQLTDLSASYAYDLTQDWTLTSGVTLRQRKETGLADAKSTSIFVTLGRSFSFRP